MWDSWKPILKDNVRSGRFVRSMSQIQLFPKKQHWWHSCIMAGSRVHFQVPTGEVNTQSPTNRLLQCQQKETMNVCSRDNRESPNPQSLTYGLDQTQNNDSAIVSTHFRYRWARFSRLGTCRILSPSQGWGSCLLPGKKWQLGLSSQGSQSERRGSSSSDGVTPLPVTR